MQKNFDIFFRKDIKIIENNYFINNTIKLTYNFSEIKLSIYVKSKNFPIYNFTIISFYQSINSYISL